MTVFRNLPSSQCCIYDSDIRLKVKFRTSIYSSILFIHFNLCHSSLLVPSARDALIHYAASCDGDRQRD